MKVLILGSGAREHAFSWRLQNSPTCNQVFAYPGNDAIFRDGISKIDIAAGATAEELAQYCRVSPIDLCIIGPETYLMQGYADTLREAGVRVVGVGKEAAQLESSKLFAKRFMTEFSIPTAPYQTAESYEDLCRLATMGVFPVVLKYDGLAAGKGVCIAHNAAEVFGFAQRVYHLREFGRATDTVLVEDFVEGQEISLIGLCDGHHFVALSSATDYKRVADGGAGPNTGGMGAISPSPFLNPALFETIQNKVVSPILEGLRSRKLAYQGALFIGLMVDKDNNPIVLEFNVRFGDPETQAILLRLESDFLKLLDATARGTLKNIETVRWSPKHSVYVVGAAQGYPHNPVLGETIVGLEDCPPTVHLFGAGIKQVGFNRYQTAGGRVLGVGATGHTLSDARTAVYDALRTIRWKGQHYRTDIGKF